MLDAMRLSREQSSSAATATYEHTATALRESRDGATCAALCRRLNGVIDAKIDALQRAGASVACAPGCAFCCHLRVDVFPHEAAALLHHLRTQVAPERAARIGERIRANALRIDALTPEQHRSAGIGCAFLENGLCSAHDVRPSACAAYHSLSRERCEHSFRHAEHIGTASNARPALLELQAFGTAQIETTAAAYRDAGLASTPAELHQALRALLDADAQRADPQPLNSGSAYSSAT
jgi:Fe-S-cluster containining protein